MCRRGPVELDKMGHLRLPALLNTCATYFWTLIVTTCFTARQTGLISHSAIARKTPAFRLLSKTTAAAKATPNANLQRADSLWKSCG